MSSRYFTWYINVGVSSARSGSLWKDIPKAGKASMFRCFLSLLQKKRKTAEAFVNEKANREHSCMCIHCISAHRHPSSSFTVTNREKRSEATSGHFLTGLISMSHEMTKSIFFRKSLSTMEITGSATFREVLKASVIQSEDYMSFLLRKAISDARHF